MVEDARFLAPVARGPLIERHRAAGARIETRQGWQVAVQYPCEPAASAAATVLADLSHRPTFEINGADVDVALTALCGEAPAVRAIYDAGAWQAYRLAPGRAIIMGSAPADKRAIDVTGGWATLALLGPHAHDVLSRVTAVDLRPGTMPVLSCCQGPLFAVNTLFGRFANRLELHLCSDSAEFVWDVLFDAGAEFNLTPAGADFFEREAAA
jgi:glycine cleavage system aminomethyltransferase T